MLWSFGLVGLMNLIYSVSGEWQRAGQFFSNFEIPRFGSPGSTSSHHTCLATVNFPDHIKGNPLFYRQQAGDQQLVTQYTCPLENPKEALRTTQGYFVYVIEGNKGWHVPGQSFDLTPGRCLCIRQGAKMEATAAGVKCECQVEDSQGKS